ncbi:MAG: CRTAC1 family protein, partial [Limisphaerales bacterium]
MSQNPKGPNESEEWVESDDRAIRTGLRWSLVALITLGVLGVGAFFALRKTAGPAKVQVTPLAAPQTVQTAQKLTLPKVPFTEVSAAAGIQFRHFTGATGEKLLPETMGAGAAFFDADGDGDADLLLVNGNRWPWDTQGPASPGCALYRNDTSAGGAIRFTDISAGSGLEAPLYGMGAAVGDYDNDGKPDVLITAVGGAHLFHNEGGGHFKDVSAAAGVGGSPDEWSTAATWFDLDNDGDLDLFVASYVKWSRAIDAEVGYKIDGSTRAYGPPMNFQGAFPHLYRNEGGGRFTDISKEGGVQVTNPSTGVPAAKSLGVVAADFNTDGFTDLIVANDTVQNFVFENQRDGHFKEVGALTGIAFDSYGNTRGAMGIDAARFTDDGKLGIAIGNFANEMTALYVGGATAGLFTDESISWGVGPTSRLPLKFGVMFFDWDLDGRLDLLSVNGHLEEEITKVQASQKYRQPAQLFWNAGAAGFVPVGPEQAGSALFTPIVGRGCAQADLDGDGDEDLLFTQTGGAPLLLRNDRPIDRRWVRLKLVGTRANRDALGATVQLKAGGKTQWRTVTANRGYLSSSALPLTFGLGEATGVESIEIVWPGGQRQSVPAPQPGTVT